MILLQLKINKCKKIKSCKCNRGNTLVEVIAAISIIIVASEILFSSILYANKCRIKSMEYEEANRVIHAIQNEIKYNYSLDEIKVLLGTSPLKLEKEEILKELRNKNLENISLGEDIVITLVDKNDTEIYFKIEYFLEGDNENKVEREYKKNSWMEKEEGIYSS